MDLYVVESPFQLISAMESYDFYKTPAILIIKYNGSRKNDTQLRLLKNMAKHDQILEIKLLNSNFFSNIALLYSLRKIKKKGVRYKRVFIGDYRSFHMRKYFDCLKSEQCFLLDDGAVMYEINDTLLKYRVDNFYFFGLKGIIKKTIYLMQSNLLNLNCKTRREINIFTCYELKEYGGNKVVRHKFDYLRSIGGAATNRQGLVYFYGSNISYLGISLEDEFVYFQYVIDYFNKRNMELIYIPHRNESEHKLKKIKSIFHIKIKKCIYPAEIDILFEKKVPQHISSFFSSVLISLPLIRQFNSVTSFYLPTKKINNTTIREEFDKGKIEYIKKMTVIEMDKITQ